MDKNLIKMVILTEKLNELCINDILNSCPLNMPLVDKVKSSQIFGNDLMDIFFANYYVKNLKNQNKSIKAIVNFIEDYSDNKDILYNCFLNNIGFANELVSNYLYNYVSNYNIDNFYENCNDSEKMIVSNLSSIFNYKSFDFLPSLSRYTLFKIACDNLSEMKDYRIESSKATIDNLNILQRILISDAYTYMSLNNENLEFNNYLNLIEENSLNMNNLWNILKNKPNCLNSFLFYMSNLFIQDNCYSDLYKEIAKNNPQFFDTLRRINPFYILDEIEDFNQKKYKKI